METLNKTVAVAPFKKETADQPRARGLDMTDVTVTKLIVTQVLFDSEKFKKGDTLYFRSDVLRWPQVNQKLVLGETTFILLPEELPVFVQKAAVSPTRPPALPVSSNGQ